MKKPLLFSAVMAMASVTAAAAPGGQGQWYRLVSHCTIANDVRVNACVELVNEASVTLTGNNMNTQNDRLWGAPQVEDASYEYQLWTLEEDPANAGVYAIVSKAAPGGSVNSSPSIAQNNTGRWDYDRNGKHYAFVLGHEDKDGEGNIGYSIRSVEQAQGYYWNMAASGQGYSINCWNDPSDSKGGIFYFIPTLQEEAKADPADGVEFINPLGSDLEWSVSACCQADHGESDGREGAASHMVDGDASSYWHMAYDNGDAAQRHQGHHYIVFDLKEARQLTGFTWTARANDPGAPEHGLLRGWEIYVSDNASEFVFADNTAMEAYRAANEAAADGKSTVVYNESGKNVETYVFDKVSAGRYVLFVATSVGQKGQWINDPYEYLSCAEFSFMAIPKEEYTVSEADRAAVEAFRDVLPGAGKLVDNALAALDSAVSADEVAAIKESLSADLQQCVSDLAADQVFLTIDNVRRGSLGQASHLAVLSDGAINTVAQPESESVWTLVETATAGAYLLYNVKADSYMGGSGAVPLMVDESEALVYTLEFLAGGHITFYPVGTDKFINVDTAGGNLVYYSFANDAGADWRLAELPMTGLFTEEEYDELAKWCDVVPGVDGAADDSNGNALTRFSVTFPCAARYTGLADGIVAISLGNGPAYYRPLDMSDVTYDEATNTFTCELSEPITEYAFFYIQVNKYAFELTDADGNVSYTDYLYSNYALCFYVPDQLVPLTVTPAAGEIESLDRIEMWIPDTEFDVNKECTEPVTVTCGEKNLVSMTAEELWDCYLEDQDGNVSFYIDVDRSDAGVYTLTVPENCLIGRTGRCERTIVTWTITDTGISDVTVNGRPSVIHDLHGRKLNRTVRGVNIVDGVKTLAR
ncbi:MAG: discoidin domain-containing protein [Muribaculaceae bacterium]|nr:discoidin domain-containing protein [Muribaculaceae bacterium]